MSRSAALRLGRVSNLPTVWTNVAAGIVLSGATHVSFYTLLFLLGSLSLFYLAGMYLNDAFDWEIDARERPDRPIPSGEVSARTVFVAGFAMLAAALALLGAATACAHGSLTGDIRPWRPLACGLLLAGAIVYYDARHKKDRLSPLFMGLCRALVYLTAALAVAPAPSLAVLAGGGVLLCYVTGLTAVAKREHLNSTTSRWPLAFLAVPFVYGLGTALSSAPAAIIYVAFLAWTARAASNILRPAGRHIQAAVTSLIAGISFLDGLLMGSSGAPGPALLAVAAVPLTLLLQRRIAGT